MQVKGGIKESSPKSKMSRRSVKLPASVVSALIIHQEAMTQEGHKSEFVFCNTIGKPLSPSNLVNRSFKPLLERAGLKSRRFHELRHTAATLLLSEGVHPKVVQELLGHSQIAITMDIYSQVLPNLQDEAAKAMERLFGEPVQPGAGEG